MAEAVSAALRLSNKANAVMRWATLSLFLCCSIVGVLLSAYLPGIPIDWWYMSFYNGDTEAGNLQGYITSDLVSKTVVCKDKDIAPVTIVDAEVFFDNCALSQETEQCASLLNKITMYYIYAGLMGLAGFTLGCGIVFYSQLIHHLRHGTLDRFDSPGSPGSCGCSHRSFLADPCTYMFCQIFTVVALVGVGVPTLPITASIIKDRYSGLEEAKRLFALVRVCTTDFSQGVKSEFNIYLGYELFLACALSSTLLIYSSRQLRRNWKDLVFTGVDHNDRFNLSRDASKEGGGGARSELEMTQGGWGSHSNPSTKDQQQQMHVWEGPNVASLPPRPTLSMSQEEMEVLPVHQQLLMQVELQRDTAQWEEARAAAVEEDNALRERQLLQAQLQRQLQIDQQQHHQQLSLEGRRASQFGGGGGNREYSKSILNEIIPPEWGAIESGGGNPPPSSSSSSSSSSSAAASVAYGASFNHLPLPPPQYIPNIPTPSTQQSRGAGMSFNHPPLPPPQFIPPMASNPAPAFHATGSNPYLAVPGAGGGGGGGWAGGMDASADNTATSGGGGNPYLTTPSTVRGGVGGGGGGGGVKDLKAMWESGMVTGGSSSGSSGTRGGGGVNPYLVTPSDTATSSPFVAPTYPGGEGGTGGSSHTSNPYLTFVPPPLGVVEEISPPSLSTGASPPLPPPSTNPYLNSSPPVSENRGSSNPYLQAQPKANPYLSVPTKP